MNFEEEVMEQQTGALVVVGKLISKMKTGRIVIEQLGWERIDPQM